MNPELTELAERVLAAAAPGELVEAYATHHRGTSVSVFEGEVEKLTVAEKRGVGIRVVRDGRLGFAATSDVTADGLAFALAAARANVVHGTVDVGNTLPEPLDWEPLPGLVDDREPPATGDKVALALDLERLTLAADPRVSGVSSASYADGHGAMVVLSSTGVRAGYARTDAYASVVALARDGSETQTGFGLSDARSAAGLDLPAAAAEAADRAVRLLGARKPTTATVPVVLDPLASARFLGVVAGALSAEAVQKGVSLFRDALDTDVGPEGFALVDDGRLPDGPGAAPVDDEGLPTGRTVLFDAGRLVSFLHDTETAARAGAGTRSTGNAARSGYGGLPGVSPANLYFDGPTASPQRLLAEAGDAFYVQELKGLHSGVNPTSGEFSVGATGLWVRGGELAEPVREVTISSTIGQMLRMIRLLGDDRRFFGGSTGGATMLLEGMTVAGS